MKRQTQQSFFEAGSEFSGSRIAHGGALRGKRKVFRPLDRKRPLHIVLKSQHAKGSLSLLGAKNKLAVQRILKNAQASCAVTIHQAQNMGNHLHLLVSFKDKQLMQKFLRVMTGLIARAATGARKGRAFGKRFWDGLAFTRVITGRRDFAKMHKYMSKNEVERELGGAMRAAVELHEKLSREAKRKGCALKDLMDELLLAADAT